MKYLLSLFFLVSSSFVFSQKEASNWCFGNFAGLKFHPDGSVESFPSEIGSQFGCATISDKNGNLLFYSNGEMIWNKEGNIMLNGNGLMGNLYCAQSVNIVPKPGVSNLYYVFTLNLNSSGNQFRYSIVNMDLDGGKGAVTEDKNILLYTPSNQKMVTIKHANGRDFWIITDKWKTNTFYSYLITSTGINLVPVLSSVGTIVNDWLNSTGTGTEMKISPDGKKLAVCNPRSGSNLELFDFDPITGKVSNPKSILENNVLIDFVEFSPNSKILYGSSGKHLYQFDLMAGDIAASKLIVSEMDVFAQGLQLGINNKIYQTAFGGTPVLSVINKPNVLGKGCDYRIEEVPLKYGYQFYGLPSFCASYFNQIIIENNLCLGTPTTFELNTTATVNTANWDFGDGASSTSLNPTHTYTNAGTYTITVTITTPEGTSTETKEIVISTVPTATTPQNISYCDTNNDGVATFDLTTQNAAILNGQDTSQFSVTYYANAADYAAKKPITNPVAYSNPVPYQTETLIAEVANLANALCKASCSFTLAVFDSPKPKANTAIAPLQKCDDTSFGTDSDRKVVFDLTQRATSILNGQSASQFVLSYYKDAALTQSIPNPAAYVNTDPFEIIYVKMANKDNLNCVESTSIAIEVLGLPVIISPVDLKQCDDDTDGFSRFNLKEAEGKISLNSGALFSYFKTPTDAQNNTNPIANPTAYTNSVASIDKVYVRVATTLGCFRIAELNLIVSTTQIPISVTKTFTQCDDSTSGSNTDGISQFDFSSVSTSIQSLFPIGQQLEIRYFKTLNDALAEQNAIPNPSNYSNTDSPFSQDIYVRVDSKLDNACLGLGKHVHLVVERIPIATPQKIVHCDDNQDGKFSFDTSGIQTNLLHGMTNVSVAYFDQNNVALSSPLPNPFLTASQTLRVVLTNTTTQACSIETTIEFVVDDLPEAFPIAANAIRVCDDELDPIQQDGTFAFTTTGFQEIILGGQTGMQVRYFDQNNVALPSPLPNPFVTHSQTVTAEVINPMNTNCTASVAIPFVVHPVPKIALVGDELVCSNLPTFTKVIDAGILDGSAASNYSYHWTFNAQPVLGATSDNLTVNTAGIYTVTTTNSTSCSRTRTITVVASDIAKITNVAIIDLAEENSITVSVTGSGDYVYSLDELSGPYQTESVFNTVKSGIHTVYVKDLNGCGISSKEVAVLGIPSFFTPNGDGHNDYWNIKGVNVNFNYKTIVYIYDRYGKLLKQLDPTSEGWDGTYTSQLLPADDYWYSIQLEDGRSFKGHFALRR
ncbi:T9SS type B sorting domain-containing protein [Flavobacterium sp.]|uniref:T9SS type B sorting domain-containing protein n=1 Tax=Flavobacterium sp. TaxID=239 RepID=UPI0025D091E0|nr:T9SS type B sorting domain-containing protein [Flavobacterium sp.]